MEGVDAEACAAPAANWGWAEAEACCVDCAAGADVSWGLGLLKNWAAKRAIKATRANVIKPCESPPMPLPPPSPPCP